MKLIPVPAQQGQLLPEQLRAQGPTLLHHLKTGTQDGSPEVGPRVAQRSSETGEPRVKVAALGNELGLILVIGDDFGQFILDEV